tara:strand:+ start:8280 stop:9326 length:1047 start_codon:yes stop_codon:yes gene_type:complete
MKKFTLLFIATLAFTFTDANAQTATKLAVAHVENGSGDTQSGRMYRANAGASRDGNGNSNAAFGNIGDWSVDLTISEKTPAQAAADFGGDVARMDNGGFGAIARASFAAGNYTRAHSLGSVAFGFVTVAGNEADRMGAGPFNGIDGGNVGQVAFGWRSVASGNGAVAMGHGSTASGAFSITTGNGNTASGEGAVAFGLGTQATGQGTVAIGKNNATTDAAFVVGNGADAGNQSDAFIVNTDGSAVFSGDVTVNSDMRLKANIISLGSTLAKLLQIDGKSYVMKKNTSEQKIGLLAQDVQAVYPELVKQANNEEGTLSVNYQGLIPVLINAIKEQQSEIDELKRLIKKD